MGVLRNMNMFDLALGFVKVLASFGNKGVRMTRFHLGIGSGIRLLVTAACVLLLCPRAFSQGSAGRISGAVTDQSGGVLAGATVTVLDVQRGISRTLTADQSGEYVAPSTLR